MCIRDSVDIAPEGKTFKAFNTEGSYVPKDLTENGAWMGGGLSNYDYAQLKASDVSYKIIARGWMDLCNPGAGYNSASADTKVALKVGENHDYTIYLQPNLYTVEEGHTLALVIYTYEQGKARYSQNYQITLDNSSVNAVIPVDQLPAVDPDPTPAENPFKDVKSGSPYYDAILWAVDNKVTNGITADTFGVNDGCTRAQIVTFLYRAAGSPSVDGLENPFTDVSKDSVYYNAILWAVEKGITKGTTETTFDPNAVCTRGQIVTFLYRASGDDKVTGVTDFTDVAADSYCADAVAWAVANGVTKGTTATTFAPNATCTRGQAVTLIYRANSASV